MTAPANPAKEQVLRIEPRAHAVSRGFRGVVIEVCGEVIATGFTVYQAWANALSNLRTRKEKSA